MRPELRCGIQTCPGTIRFRCVFKTKEFAVHETFASPEFQSKREKKRAPLLGAGYTKYQLEMIFLGLFRAKNVFLWRTIITAPSVV